MKQRRSALTAAIAVLIAFTALSWCRPAQADTVRITIFHTNDMHGKIDPLAKIARLVDAERKKNPNVFLMGAGDNFSGNPIVDQYTPRGLPVLELFNRLGYDLVTLGNHEFDYGQETLRYHLQHASYKVVCANMKVRKGTIPQPPPYAVLKTSSGVRIAVLGLIQIGRESRIPDTHPDRVKGIRFTDPLETAGGFRFLRKENQVFIALTHIGFDQDVLLARKLPELDCIIGGHSHTAVLQPAEFNGVLITQAGSNGQYLGRIDIDLKNGRIVSKKGELIDLGKISDEDPQVAEMIARFNHNPALARVIGHAPMPVTGKDELGSLMTDAVRVTQQLDIVFQNNGGIRSDVLQNDIRIQDLYQLDPFGNDVVRFEMTPAEIRSLISRAFDRRKGIDLQVSGIEYAVRQTPEGTAAAIEIKSEDGGPFDERKNYTVGLSSYIASAYSFEHRDPGTSLFITTAECLIRYIGKGADLSRYRGIVRARILPSVAGGAPVPAREK
jgi:5'-nucleotidase / UDP-sugar diphosphatase